MVAAIGKALRTYREAAVNVLFWGAVMVMVAAAPPPVAGIPSRPVPSLRTVGPPPTTVPPTTTTMTTTLPPTSTMVGVGEGPRPGQAPPAAMPSASTSAPPTVPPTTVPTVPTVPTTAPPTTTIPPRNKAHGLTHADDMAERGICVKVVDHGTRIQQPCHERKPP